MRKQTSIEKYQTTLEVKEQLKMVVKIIKITKTNKQTNKMKTTQTGKAKAVDSEMAVAREWAAIACIWAETPRQAEEWESLIAEKRKAPVTPHWETVGCQQEARCRG